MATIDAVVSEIRTFGDNAHLIVWETLTGTNDTGSAIEMPGSSGRSVQVVGTFDTTTLVIQGSNDGTTWVTLNDLDGNALSFTAAGFEGIREVPRYIRPFISADGGSGDLDVHMIIRRPY